MEGSTRRRPQRRQQRQRNVENIQLDPSRTFSPNEQDDDDSSGELLLESSGSDADPNRQDEDSVKVRVEYSETDSEFSEENQAASVEMPDRISRPKNLGEPERVLNPYKRTPSAKKGRTVKPHESAIISL